MKGKILFFTIGAVVVMLSVYIGNIVSTEDITIDTKDMNPTFDTVEIKGSLLVGNEDNFIILKNNKDSANVILQSKGSVIHITTTPKGSSITVGKILGEHTNIGVMLTQEQRPQGNLVTHFLLKDSYGENIIRTTD
jgi:hypothetical protein